MKLRKFIERIKTVFGETNPHHRFWQSVESYKECKKPLGDTLIHRFLQGIWLHTLKGDWANTSNIWPPQRNCHSHNDALWKHKSKSSITRWKHRLLWHCCWCSAKGHISSIFVHNLPRRLTLNVDWSDERKWLYTKKARSRPYPAQTITGADYADDIALLAITPTQAEPLQQSLELAAGGIGLYMNADNWVDVF